MLEITAETASDWRFVAAGRARVEETRRTATTEAEAMKDFIVNERWSWVFGFGVWLEMRVSRKCEKGKKERS
jgi:hypothetical protein